MTEQVLRLFVSSPGDVADERRRIDLVVERLNTEFEGRARIESIRWETSYYSAHDTFQKQIPATIAATMDEYETASALIPHRRHNATATFAVRRKTPAIGRRDVGW